MNVVAGIALPDRDQHLPPILETGQPYQGAKFATAMEWVRDWRVAIDVGAHVGLWTRPLAKRFARVHAFEPQAENRECFKHNVDAGNVVLHAVALGAKASSVRLAGVSASAFIAGEGQVPMLRLDDFAFHDVDFLKLDCVGYEWQVLQGAAKTLARCKPCISVEQKPGYAQRFGQRETEAVDWLQALGARLRMNSAGVYTLSWDK